MEEMMEGRGCAVDQRKAGARPQEQLNCPRCKSSNTKFCYYNNYSLTQPRYFCKSCRRYWTEGGSLRNVPVGGGSRKNRKSTSLNPTSTHNAQPQPYQPHDLNLAFPAAPPSSAVSGSLQTLPRPENNHRPAFCSYIPNLMPFSVHPAGVSLDGREIKYGMQENDVNGGRFAFSFADHSKQQQLFSSSNEVDLMSSKGQESSTTGYWNGMLGGGPSPW